MVLKYNVDLLKSICVEFNISVEIVNYKNLNRNDEIAYICNECGNNYKKKFRSLYDSSNKCIYCFNKSKYSEWLEKSKKFHEDVYDYSKVVFNNLSTKVIIICKVHGEFQQTPSNHTRFGCSKCYGNYNYTTDEWIEKAKEVHGNKYDYSKVEYIRSCEEIKIICNACKYEFNQVANAHMQGCGCSKCSGNYNYTTEEWVEKAKEVHGNKYDYSKAEYINTNTKVKIICSDHGEFEQTPNCHTSQKQGCPECGDESSATKRSYTEEEWIQKAKEVHGNKYDYSKVEYDNSKTKVMIICREHGEFEQNPCAHTNKQGCPCCNIFKSESLCRSILNNLTNSNFIKARPKFLGGLELDGYCEELKCAFEYNGKQHYYYNEYFHRNGIKDLISQNIRDKMKKQICEKNGIKLISIPYTYDHKNVEELEEYIKFHYYKKKSQ